MGCCLLTYVVIVLILYKLWDRLLRWFWEGRKTSRYILVTGCDTGFGHELVKRLDSRGVQVFAGCLTQRGQDELRRICSVQVDPLYLDVTKPETIRKAYEYIKTQLPAHQGLWALVNNAGILGRFGPEEWMRIEDYREVLDVNLYGLIDVTMTFLPLVKMTPRGRIINNASVFGRHALAGCSPYCVSQYGIEAFSDGLRRSLRVFDVQVVLVEPGLHRTPMTAKPHVGGMFDKAWKALSADVRAFFGEDFYRRGLERIDRVHNGLVSDRTSDVVDAYEHALLWYYPRSRYVVGRDARFLWLPIQALPEWLGDWVLEKFNPVRALPVALRQ